MSNEKSKSLSFEVALENLESLIEEMESGQIPLDDLIDKYEKGSELLKFCQDKLGDAELRIEKIREKSDGSLESETISAE